jgi:hypothetical protein
VKAIWDNQERIKRLSTQAAWWAVVFAFIAAAAGLVEVVTGVANVTSIPLAFLSGLAGLSAKVADRRKRRLEDVHKRTKPKMDVAIKTHEPTGRLLVVIEPQNRVPFEFQWIIVTRNNTVVSGIPLEWAKVIPSDQKPRFTQRADFDMSKVVDNYIELRFDYRSIYAHELPNLDLSGKLIRAYKLTADRRYCIATDSQT